MPVYLSIVHTILLMVIAGGIAYLIYRSTRPRGTRKSLRLRRQEVYDDVVHILTILGHTGEIRKEELLDFRSRTQDAALLFDVDIASYIDEIYARSVKLMSTGELLRGTSVPVGEERDRVTVENAKQTIWLADQLSKIRKRFDRYIPEKQYIHSP